MLGFVVTAIGVASRLGTVSLRLLPAAATAIGVLLLSATVLIGIGTYTVTEYPGKMTAKQRAQLDQSPNSARRLSGIYRTWNDLNEDEIRTNSTYLGVTLLALSGGMLALLVAGLQIAVPEILPQCSDTKTLWCFSRFWAELAVIVPVAVLPLGTKLLLSSEDDGV